MQNGITYYAVVIGKFVNGDWEDVHLMKLRFTVSFLLISRYF